MVTDRESEVSWMDDLINRQRAIDAVTDELDMIDHVPQWVFDRLEERLKQLPPAQPAPCEDAVSRKAAIDGLNDAVHEHNITDFDAVATILALPSVTPKQRTGRWNNGDPICPVCGEDKFKDLYADIWADWQPNFCPNCGAKMEVTE